jgi:dolichyl-phosphate-mannose-protein mannosyltransferase
MLQNRELTRTAIVLILCFIVLGIGIERATVASAFSDPVAKIRAQDESTYANSAMGLATGANWLTPRVTGRFLLYKPPALVWLAGASLKIGGTSLFALRFPDLLAAALATAMVFWWSAADARTAYYGWIAVILLLSNPLWHTFARLCYTDMLLALALTGSMFCLRFDFSLGHWWSFGGFAFFTSLGVMTKNIAGVIPLLALVVCALWLPRKQRPTWTRISGVVFLVLVVITPWHVYQYIVHREWFWADYVKIQLLGFGMRPPSQTSSENAAIFYGKRLALIDPVLLGLAIAAIPNLVAHCRKGVPSAILLTSWLAVMAAALLTFQYRNLQYAVMLMPALALLASVYLPMRSKIRPRLLIALLVCLFAVRAVFPARTWGLSFGASPPIPEASVMRAYYELGRPNELIPISPDDEFYTFVLPGMRVRYCFIDPDGRIANYAPHFRYLGITVNGDEFLHMAEWHPVFSQRLRSWGLESQEAIASVILVPTVSDAIRIIQQRSDADFEIPQSLLPDGGVSLATAHDIRPAGPGRIFLLAKNPPGTAQIKRVRLPQRW